MSPSDFDHLQFFHNFEKTFICIGIIALVLGSIISIWTVLDSEFQNLHKPSIIENGYKMSGDSTTSMKTDAKSSFIEPPRRVDSQERIKMID